MSVSLLVPWRTDSGIRERLWGWARRYWEARYPEWEIIECDDGSDPYTRGRSLNVGAERASGDVFVIADADTVVSMLPLERVADRDWTISYAAGRYLSLSDPATERLLAADPAAPLAEPARSDQRTAPITSFSGCILLTRTVFERAGGYDPRFVGWGYEDDAFRAAADTLWRPFARSPGFAVHLAHPHLEAERFEQPHIAENRELSVRYRHVYGNISAMRALVAEARAGTTA